MAPKKDAPSVGMSSGTGSANNAEVKDFDTAPMTRAEMEKYQREYTQKLNKNIVEISASVVDNFKSIPKPVLRDGIPVLEEDGDMKYYPSHFTCKLAFNGGEKEISISEEWYNDLEIGSTRYLFVGRMGLVKSYGKESIDVIFQNFTEI